MIKKGFTLAEVLITLSIIGVVAALTMPGLIQNVGGAKTGPALAKFVSTFEAAAQRKKLDSMSSTLTSGGVFNEAQMEGMKKYYPMTKYNGKTIDLFYSSGPESAGSISNTTANTYATKDGTILTFASSDNASFGGRSCIETRRAIVKGDTGVYKGCVGTVTVVLNTTKSGRSVMGKDVFYFIIDDSGTLLPYGSNIQRDMVDTILGKGKSNTYVETCDASTAFPELTDEEKNDKSGSGDSTAWKKKSAAKLKLLACTGAIADNGWKLPN